MLFYCFLWTYSENFSLFCSNSSIQVMFFENDSHFGRHLGFLGKLTADCPALLVCCSTAFSGPILKISACSNIQVIFFENDSHFGRHLGFLGKLHGDSPGLLVCCSTDFSGPILKISACYEKCPGFITF